MKKAIVAVLALAVAGPLCAEDKGIGYGLKLRAQTGLESVDGMRNGFGFGVYTTIPFGPGAIGVELGYQTWNGKQYRQDIGANPFGLTNPAPVGAVLITDSVDARKSTADGLAVRVSYEQKFSGAWGLHGGLALSKLKGKQESITTFGSDGAFGSWATTAEKSSLTFSPFVGAQYDLGEKGALEFNLLLDVLKMPTVTPGYNAAATGTARVTPLVSDKTITKPKIELSYAFRF
jgi:hypothetical protein